MKLPVVPGDFSRTLQQILTALGGRLTLLENIQYNQVSVSDTGAADSQLTITHNLGRVPTAYFWNIDRSGTVYDSNKANWSSSTIYVKCSTAHSSITLTLL